MLPPRLATLAPEPGVLVNSEAVARVPQYVRPAYCDEVARDAHNAQFLAHANHPCTFLARGIQLPDTIEQVLA